MQKLIKKAALPLAILAIVCLAFIIDSNSLSISAKTAKSAKSNSNNSLELESEVESEAETNENEIINDKKNNELIESEESDIENQVQDETKDDSILEDEFDETTEDEDVEDENNQDSSKDNDEASETNSSNKKKTKSKTNANSTDESSNNSSNSNKNSKNASTKATKKITYTKKDLKYLAAIIFCEANNQSQKSKIAVANVILNRRDDKKLWGHVSTIKEVIYDKKWGVQFSPAYSKSGSLKNALALYKNLEDYEGTWRYDSMNNCIKAAKAALSGKKSIPDNYYYFNANINSSKSKCKSKGKEYKVIDAHIYF